MMVGYAHPTKNLRRSGHVKIQKSCDMFLFLRIALLGSGRHGRDRVFALGGFRSIGIGGGITMPGSPALLFFFFFGFLGELALAFRKIIVWLYQWITLECGDGIKIRRGIAWHRSDARF